MKKYLLITSLTLFLTSSFADAKTDIITTQSKKFQGPIIDIGNGETIIINAYCNIYVWRWEMEWPEALDLAGPTYNMDFYNTCVYVSNYMAQKGWSDWDVIQR